MSVLAFFGATATFVRGAVFGALLTLLLEAAVLVWLVRSLAKPGHRFTPPSPGDRPSADPVPTQLPPIPPHDALRLGRTSLPGRPAPPVAAGLPEHLRPWPAAIVAFLARELTPRDSDTPVVAGRPVARSTLEAMQSLRYSASSISGAAAAADASAGAGQPTLAAATSAAAAATSATSPLPAAHESEPVAVGEMEPCHWLNVALHRFFLSFRASQHFKESWTQRMSKKLNMRLKNNSFVTSIQIRELSLGDNSPSIHGIRLLKGVTKDLAVFGEAEVSYEGGGSILLEVTLSRNITVPARVYLNQFTGVIRVRAPSLLWPDMIGVAFVEDPGISFTVETGNQTGGDGTMFVRGMINSAIASIVRKTFLELWVLPSWRTFFLPQMQPSAEEFIVRSQTKKEMAAVALAASKQAPAPAVAASGPPRPTLVDRASALWESRLRGPKAARRDLLQGTTFDVTLPLQLADAKAVDEMDASLVSSFLALVNEPDDPVNSSSASNPALRDVDEPGGSESGSAPSLGAAAPAAAASSSPQQQPLSLAPSVSGSGTAASGTATAPTAPSTPSSSSTAATAAVGSSQTAPASSGWKTIRNRNGVHVQKRVLGVLGSTDMVRAFVTIACDAERVARVLLNPAHFAHVYETFEGARSVHEFDAPRGVLAPKFRFGRGMEKNLLVFATRRTLRRTAGDGAAGSGPADVEAEVAAEIAASLESLGDDLGVERIFVMRSIGSIQAGGGQGSAAAGTTGGVASAAAASSASTSTAAALTTALGSDDAAPIPGAADTPAPDSTAADPAPTVDLHRPSEADVGGALDAASEAGADGGRVAESEGAASDGDDGDQDPDVSRHLRVPADGGERASPVVSRSRPVDVPADGGATPAAATLTPSPSGSAAALRSPRPMSSSASLSSKAKQAAPSTSPQPAGLARTPEDAAATAGDGKQQQQHQACVYIYGYHVVPLPADPKGSCRVTIVAHLSPDLQKLEVDTQSCRKLKQFIEDLDQLSRDFSDAAAEATGEVRRRRVFPFGGGGSNASGTTLAGAGGSSALAGTGWATAFAGNQGAGSAPEADGRRIDKIKNYLGNTANYLMKNRKTSNASWLPGRSASQQASQDAQDDMGDDASYELVGTDGDVSARHAPLETPGDGNAGSQPSLPRRQARSATAAADGAQERSASASIASALGLQHAPSASAPVLGPKTLATIAAGARAAAAVAAVAANAAAQVAANAGAAAHASSGEISIIAPRRSLAFEMTEFGREPYIERVLHPKDIVRVEIPFNRAAFGPAVVLEWEHMMRSEAAARFGIIFVPDNPHTSQRPVVQLLPFAPSSDTSRDLFPVAAVQSYTGPAYGTALVSGFGSGVFVLVWDNLMIQSKKVSKSFAYKCLVHNLEPPAVLVASAAAAGLGSLGLVGMATRNSPQGSSQSLAEHEAQHAGGQAPSTQIVELARIGACAEVAIQRNTYFALPIVYDASTAGADAVMDGGATRTVLEWEFTTGGSDINFGIFYEPLVDAVSIPPATPFEPPVYAFAASAGGSQRRSSNAGVADPSHASARHEDSRADVHSDTSTLDAAHGGDGADLGSSGEQLHGNVPPPMPPRASLSERLAAAVGRDPAAPAPAQSVSSPPPPAGSAASPPRTVASMLSSRFAAARSKVDSQRSALLGTTAASAGAPGQAGSAVPSVVNLNAEFMASGSLHRQMVVPPARLNSARMVGGAVSASMDITGRFGVFIFLWDNSTSIISSRTVAFKVNTVTTTMAVMRPPSPAEAADPAAAAAVAATSVSAATETGAETEGGGLDPDADVEELSAPSVMTE
ncbi:hypothetical protein HK105_200797 [Polyrhizophydium stewartii]|uniref:SMP-LTD domain-containing protein n=1 Tax=Polyrhizophydium stewartii TaxID=2732419 RepID=A0ABR4NK17_9FUNG